MKRKNTVGLLLFITGFLFYMSSCEYYSIPPKPIEVPDSVSFSLNVVPIFNNNCNISGCHSSGAISPDLSPDNAFTSLTFFGYLDLDSAELSPLYTKITTGSMKEYPSDEDRQIILKWIQQGALDN